MRLPLVPLMCLSCALCQPTRRRTAPDPAASTETQHERGEPCSITPPPTHHDATRRHDAHVYVSTYATTTNTSPLIGRLAAARAAARHAMSSQPKARAVCSVPRPAVPLCLESCEKLEAGSYMHTWERSGVIYVHAGGTRLTTRAWAHLYVRRVRRPFQVWCGTKQASRAPRRRQYDTIDSTRRPRRARHDQNGLGGCQEAPLSEIVVLM